MGKKDGRKVRAADIDIDVDAALQESPETSEAASKMGASRRIAIASIAQGS